MELLTFQLFGTPEVLQRYRENKDAERILLRVLEESPLLSLRPAGLVDPTEEANVIKRMSIEIFGATCSGLRDVSSLL